MKNVVTEIAYPMSDAESYDWGFDLFTPAGAPRAWITDWDDAAPGFGISEEVAGKVLAYEGRTSLDDISVDEIFASHSLFTKRLWHSTMRAIAEGCGAPIASEVAAGLGYSGGTRTWQLTQQKFGTGVSIEHMAWHQDIAHLLSGTTNQAYAWFDDEKLVISRSNCFMRAPAGMEDTAQFCRDFDDAHIVAYMEVEKDLLIASIGCCCELKVVKGDSPDVPVQLRDARTDPTAAALPGGRAIHVWTYKPEVINALPEAVKALVSPSLKSVLAAKGCEI